MYFSPQEALRNIHSVLPEIRYIYKKSNNKWYVSHMPPTVGFTNWMNFNELLLSIPIEDKFVWEDSLYGLD